MNSALPAIEIENLSYSYKSHWSWRGHKGLDSLSLTINQGESFGFLGHNGAGKTTTIKCILGLLKPNAGYCRIFGVDSSQLESRAHVGYVPEQPYFYDHLTVSEILTLYGTLAGIERRQIKTATEDAAGLLKIRPLLKRPMRSLSKGQTQRVAMAQALIAKPRLLILDEPLSGLDPIGRKEFADILCQQKANGVTIFMSSHILSDVEFLCSRVSILSHGVLKGVFTLSDLPTMLSGRYELITRAMPSLKQELSSLSDEIIPQGIFFRFYFQDKTKAEAALALAIKAGAGVESFQFLHGRLEDLFVKLVQCEGEASK